MRYDYKVVPAPDRGEKTKGVKGPEGRFAAAIERIMNDMAERGWEYQRTDTLPSQERAGLTQTVTVWRNLLIFRRPNAADVSNFAPRMLTAPLVLDKPIVAGRVPEESEAARTAAAVAPRRAERREEAAPIAREADRVARAAVALDAARQRPVSDPADLLADRLDARMRGVDLEEEQTAPDVRAERVEQAPEPGAPLDAVAPVAETEDDKLDLEATEERLWGDEDPSDVYERDETVPSDTDESLSEEQLSPLTEAQADDAEEEQLYPAQDTEAEDEAVEEQLYPQLTKPEPQADPAPKTATEAKVEAAQEADVDLNALILARASQQIFGGDKAQAKPTEAAQKAPAASNVDAQPRPQNTDQDLEGTTPAFSLDEVLAELTGNQPSVAPATAEEGREETAEAMTQTATPPNDGSDVAPVDMTEYAQDRAPEPVKAVADIFDSVPNQVASDLKTAAPEQVPDTSAEPKHEIRATQALRDAIQSHRKEANKAAKPDVVAKSDQAAKAETPDSLPTPDVSGFKPGAKQHRGSETVTGSDRPGAKAPSPADAEDSAEEARVRRRAQKLRRKAQARAQAEAAAKQPEAVAATVKPNRVVNVGDNRIVSRRPTNAPKLSNDVLARESDTDNGVEDVGEIRNLPGALTARAARLRAASGQN